MSSLQQHKKLKCLNFSSSHIKAAACTALSAAVCITGAFGYNNDTDLSRMIGCHSVSSFNISSINTKSYKQISPTDLPTKVIKKTTKKTAEKKVEKPIKKSVKGKENKPQNSPEVKGINTKSKVNAKPKVDAKSEVNSKSKVNAKPKVSTKPKAADKPVKHNSCTKSYKTEAKPLMVRKENTKVGGKFLISIDRPDPSYSPRPVSLTKEDYDLACRIVMGEMGSEGFVGASIVAQAIRDTMNLEGYTTVGEVIRRYGYSGSTGIRPNKNSIDAVNFIFGENGSAFQHRVLYFYASNWSTSRWHESQRFIYQHNNVRFFDRNF